MKSEIAAIRNIAIVKLFMGSGLRIEELVGLDIDDLYFDNPKCRYVMIMEKGEYDEKVQVLINQSAYDALMDYIKIRNAI
jgi:site-specific recombinase XerC